MIPLRRMRVTFGDDDGPVWEAYTDERTWNGFACPLFDVETFARVREWTITHCAMPDDPGYAEYKREAEEDFAQITPDTFDTVDGPRVLYDCGGWLCFMEPDDE